MDEKLQAIVTSPKTAAAVSAAAAGSGFVNITDVISFFSVFGAGILTFVLIVVHIVKSVRDGRETKLRLINLELEADLKRLDLKKGKKE